jgi:predicted nucleic acid-binding protein
MEKKEILDTSIAIESKEGMISIFTVIEHPPSISRFEIIFPEDMDYMKAIEISNKLREIGKPIGAIDIIIAAMCLNRNSKLITKDKDFEIIKRIFPDFLLGLEN